MFHMVGEQFLAFFSCITVFIVFIVVVVPDRVIGATVVGSKILFTVFNLFFLFVLAGDTDFCNV